MAIKRKVIVMKKWAHGTATRNLNCTICDLKGIPSAAAHQRHMDEEHPGWMEAAIKKLQCGVARA